jgi:hypothetical protein
MTQRTLATFMLALGLATPRWLLVANSDHLE